MRQFQSSLERSIQSFFQCAPLSFDMFMSATSKVWLKRGCRKGEVGEGWNERSWWLRQECSLGPEPWNWMLYYRQSPAALRRRAGVQYEENLYASGNHDSRKGPCSVRARTFKVMARGRRLVTSMTSRRCMRGPDVLRSMYSSNLVSNLSNSDPMGVWLALCSVLARLSRSPYLHDPSLLVSRKSKERRRTWPPSERTMWLGIKSLSFLVFQNSRRAILNFRS